MTDLVNGKQVPDRLGDRMFKGVFDPRVYPADISGLISSILGRRVTIISTLDKEGYIPTEDSKGLIFDMLVKFDDGSFAIVEVQKKGAGMPPKRSAAYSANMLTGQFAKERGKKKSEIDYDTLRPVYTIVLIEDSNGKFSESDEFHHHFRQVSDTGIESGAGFELLQYYDFLCLDVYRRTRPHEASELMKWMDFLTIKSTVEMEKFVAENTEFSDIYRRLKDMMNTKNEYMEEIARFMHNEDIVASLNKTNASMVKRLTRENEEQARMIEHKEGMLRQAQQKYEELESANTDLQQTNTDLQQENTDLQQTNTDLQQEIADLSRRLAKYEALDQE